jgi:hypothetical protein
VPVGIEASDVEDAASAGATSTRPAEIVTAASAAESNLGRT